MAPKVSATRDGSVIESQGRWLLTEVVPPHVLELAFARHVNLTWEQVPGGKIDVKTAFLLRITPDDKICLPTCNGNANQQAREVRSGPLA